VKRLTSRRLPVFTLALIAAVVVAVLAPASSHPPTVTVAPMHTAALPAIAPVKSHAEKTPLNTAKQPSDEASDVREAVPANRFSMVGLTWTGPKPDSLEIRTQNASGLWTAWRVIGVEDAAPDKAMPAQTSEPVWTGPASRVRVRAKHAGATVTPQLSVVTIDPGQSPNDNRVKLDASGSGVPTMPAVVTRAEWGADESLMTWPPEYAPTVKAAVIHHTADSNDYTCDQSAALVRAIYYYHSVTNGWGDIGYNALVDKCGNIFEGRSGGLNLPAIGAHTGGFNTGTFGIAMIGDYTSVTPPAETIDAVSQMVGWKLSNSYDDPTGTVTLTGGGFGSKYPEGSSVTLPVIFAHRDVWATDCPGDAGYAELGPIRTQVAQLVGDWRSGPVYQKWQALGGDAVLGSAYSVETDWPGGGRATDFGSGASTIAWRSDFGAHWVLGAIHQTFVVLGGQGKLGYPITDETGTPDRVGRYNHFSNDGSIYWTPSTGAHAVYGAIHDRWSATGWEAGPVGYPTTNETGTPDGIGRYNHFNGSGGSSIYWTPSTGAHAIYGAIRGLWSSMGWERSWLGYPTSDEYSVPGGRQNNFQNGYIVWTASTGVTTAYHY
jgi:uncharacterized protein with LGFP repeats